MKKIKYSHNSEKASQTAKQEKRQMTGKKMMVLSVVPFALLFIWAIFASVSGATLGFFGNQDKTYGVDAFNMIIVFGGILLSPILVAALIMFIAGLILTLMKKNKKLK